MPWTYSVALNFYLFPKKDDIKSNTSDATAMTNTLVPSNELKLEHINQEFQYSPTASPKSEKDAFSTTTLDSVVMERSSLPKNMDEITCTKKPKLNDSSSVTKSNIQRPNWFLALQFDNREILDNVKTMQNDVIELQPNLSRACVPVEKSHITFFVLYTENVDKVIEIVSEVIANYKFDNER